MGESRNIEVSARGQSEGLKRIVDELAYDPKSDLGSQFNYIITHPTKEQINVNNLDKLRRVAEIVYWSEFEQQDITIDEMSAPVVLAMDKARRCALFAQRYKPRQC